MDRPRRVGSAQRAFAGASLLAVTLLPVPARADLRMCNQTASKVGIALGYRDPQGWVTEGWWDVALVTETPQPAGRVRPVPVTAAGATASAEHRDWSR